MKFKIVHYVVVIIILSILFSCARVYRWTNSRWSGFAARAQEYRAKEQDYRKAAEQDYRKAAREALRNAAQWQAKAKQASVLARQLEEKSTILFARRIKSEREREKRYLEYAQQDEIGASRCNKIYDLCKQRADSFLRKW